MTRVHLLAVAVTGALALLPAAAGGDARTAAVIVGTDDRDVLRGTGGADTIRGEAKDDRISGRGGSDAIDGGTGEDAVNGGAGNDRLFGSSGGDRLTGGSGRDRIAGGKDDDVIYARDGARDSISCGTGKPDRVIADRSDRVAGDCENVGRR